MTEMWPKPRFQSGDTVVYGGRTFTVVYALRDLDGAVVYDLADHQDPNRSISCYFIPENVLLHDTQGESR